MRRRVAILFAAAVACSSGQPPTSPGKDTGSAKPPVDTASNTSVRVTVHNYLVGAVSLAVGSTGYGSIQSNDSSVLTLDRTVSQLTWTPSHAVGANGLPIPDDLGPVTVSLPGTSAGIDISHLAGGQAYFSPQLSNYTTVAMDVAIAQNGVVQCLTSLGPGDSLPGLPVVPRVFRFGYYRVVSTTQLRIYQYNSNCASSTYFYWKGDDIAMSAGLRSGDIQFAIYYRP